MILQSFPYLEIFLGFLGFGLAILFCTSFCRSCTRLREVQREREAQHRREQDTQLRSIYFIPFPRSISQQDNEDMQRSDHLSPPRYSTTVRYEPPPSYNELGIKPDDPPPPYTEHNIPDILSTQSPTQTNLQLSQELFHP
ncbi:uncharacterized protein si:dkey-283b1.6 [Girardinichthys multiradiatus]|uniref:uncharacterized protein si:dkey-283b1.6 n=1 Tax=Girardinichthys multiradiatus TaxID=208333 RepID=UPI001FABE151|nr:uncharacterized protein si:dkey-283b1.6 [Girardinichthys multiradiatus]